MDLGPRQVLKCEREIAVERGPSLVGEQALHVITKAFQPGCRLGVLRIAPESDAETSRQRRSKEYLCIADARAATPGPLRQRQWTGHGVPESATGFGRRHRLDDGRDATRCCPSILGIQRA